MIEAIQTHGGTTPMPKEHEGVTYYRPEKLADELDVHPNTIRNWIRRGYIHAVRFGIARKSPLYIPEKEYQRVIDAYVSEVQVADV